MKPLVAVVLTLSAVVVLGVATMVRVFGSDVMLINPSTEPVSGVHVHFGPLSRGPYEVPAGERVRVPLSLIAVERDLAVLGGSDLEASRTECGQAPRLGTRFLVVLDERAASCRVDT